MRSESENASLCEAKKTIPAHVNREALLAYEKETLGFYITGHPLENYQAQLEDIGTITFSDALVSIKDKRDLTVCGLVVNIKEMKTKKKDTMAYVQMEDMKGTFTAICFADVYMNAYSALHSDNPLVLKCYADPQDEEVKVIVNEIYDLEDFFKGFTKDSSIHIYLNQVMHTKEDIVSLYEILKRYHGQNNGYIHILNHTSDTSVCLGEKYKICGELEKNINDAIPGTCVKYIN